jgi:ferric iron reductase protein FhuF
MPAALRAEIPDLAGLVEAARYIVAPPPSTRRFEACIRYVQDGRAEIDDDDLRAQFVPIGKREREECGHGPDDPRADASHWLRYYCAAVATLPFMALAAGIPIDASIYRCAIEIEDGHPMRLLTPLAKPTAEALELMGTHDREAIRAVTYGGLIERHMKPLIDRVVKVVKLDPRVLWSTVGEVLDIVTETAARRVDAAIARSAREERDFVVSAEHLPGVDGPNPLRGTVTYELPCPDIYPHPTPLRPMCCIVFHIRRPEVKCRTCPLATPEERAVMWRDRAALVAQKEASSTAANSPGPRMTLVVSVPGIDT